MREVAEMHPGMFIRYHKGFEAWKNLMRHETRDSKTRVVLLTGPTGCGKTVYANSIAKALYPDEEPYQKDSTKWFHRYEGQKVVIIDEFYGQIPYKDMLKLMDRYPMDNETKGGYTAWYPKLLIITSNADPESFYNLETPWKPAFFRRVEADFRFKMATAFGQPDPHWVKVRQPWLTGTDHDVGVIDRIEKLPEPQELQAQLDQTGKAVEEAMSDLYKTGLRRANCIIE